MSDILHRATPFSYECQGCGRCCHHKRIQANPYELLRLARNRGMSTGEFARRYLEREGPYLQVTETGACVFLDGKACAVHADRPLACRIYPLGRWVSAEGAETFRELQPHPQTEGRYGCEGSVAGFLEQQGTGAYIHAADRYQALFYRLFDALQHALPSDIALPVEALAAMSGASNADAPAFMEWLDADAMVQRHCAAQAIAVPSEIDDITNLHIQAIDAWLNRLLGGQHDQE